MKNLFFSVVIFVFVSSISAQTVVSPNGNLSLIFKLSQTGEPVYQLSYKGKAIIKESKMGFEIKDQPALLGGFTIVETKPNEKNETWNPVWGEVKTIRNHYKELAVTLQQVVGVDEKEMFTQTPKFFRAQAIQRQKNHQKIGIRSGFLTTGWL
jgi:hypothetical protein